MIVPLLALAATALAAPVTQVPLGGDDVEAFHGSLSSWAHAVKNRFLGDLAACAPSILANTTAQSTACAQVAKWSIVMGNEAGDLDSLTSAIAWAFYLAHEDLGDKSGLMGKKGKKGKHGDKWEERPVVPLLQTEEDAIDLRPENKIALREYGNMRRGHADILTLDELPLPPSELAPHISGIYLVDHNRVRSDWGEAGAKAVKGVLDHHNDLGLYPDAKPRVIEPSGSCASLVVHEILDLWDKEEEDMAFGDKCVNSNIDNELKPHPTEIPEELADLLLAVIALDTDDFHRGNGRDLFASKAIWRWSSFCRGDEDREDVMDRLDKELGTAKRDLKHLTVRDLLRRDWKGDIIPAPNASAPALHLGIASIPVSMRAQISRAGNHTPAAWFEIEKAWTKEISADVSLALTSYREGGVGDELFEEDEDDEDDDDDDEPEGPKGAKRREIALVVQDGRRLTRPEADSLFVAIATEIQNTADLNVTAWTGGDLGGERRMVWDQWFTKASRKVVRPAVERAVEAWYGQPIFSRDEDE
ncbi:DHH phosphoesterase [Ceratobasidium sp. AG-I]|nr:DHH phosphoesterase [Ceratobasidium sp. AG-I]